ncbi:MAG: CinA family nicotinamide mononucleotide deamidase-related protein [Myxococcales bacterium]|nr:CinA family nicotinamide mononucleotide deamidase-related protein [Myxococcales bacterium]
MSVAFLAIGDELLRGNTHESNGHHAAKELERLGVQLLEARHVSDARDDVVRAVNELATRAKLVLVTGGLGPTDDDQSRAALAEAVGVPLRRHPDVLAALESRFAARGRPFTETNQRQADFPDGAEVLTNEFGTAPGFSQRVGAALFACFPGVPREFQGMLRAHLTALLAQARLTATPRSEHMLRIFGITESALQERIAALPCYEQVQIRSLPRFPEIRLHSTGPDPAWGIWLDAVRDSLGWRLFSEDPSASIGDITRNALARRDATVAVAESCTGGLIGDLLTDAAGMSQHLLADLVCYSNAAKTSLLGVPAALIDTHGAVSEEVAAAMAEGARARTGAEFSVATTGIAGPSGGTDDKPVGTICMAVTGPGGTASWRQVFRGLDRRRFKVLVAWAALARLRRALADA